MNEYNKGDWIKIKDEDECFQILKIDTSTGFAKVEGVSGHQWITSLNTIQRLATDSEMGACEPTTADEYNEI